MKDNYKEIEDFLNDESFISFVYGTNKKSVEEWDLWLYSHPEKNKITEQAIVVLRSIQIKEIPVSKTQIDKAEARIRASINEAGNPGKLISLRRKIWYWSAAAVVIVAFTFGLKDVFHNPLQKMEFATDYGHIKKDKLPDGTEVILNSNTNIVLSKKWEEGTAREVWVKGEAFFHVKTTSRRDKFIVHTNAFDIEVTGTSFNVINEEHKSSVVLKEGSIKIHRPGEAEIIMKPGDFIEFNNNQVEKKKMEKEDYLAWTQNKLVFEDTKLPEVAKIIKEHYGIEVILEGKDIEEKTITGIMPNDNLEVLLQSLEATQEFLIHRSKGTITIINKKP